MIDVKLPSIRKGQPTWFMAMNYPRQGYWTEEEFLAVEGNDNWLKELSNGYFETPPVPTLHHHDVLLTMLFAFKDHLQLIKDGGEVLTAPLPVRLFPGTIREPDLIYLSAARRKKTNDYPNGADLVAEVVIGSKADRQRDLVTKRKEYAQAGILEYWIVDPKTTTVLVLTLNKATKRYKVHGKYTAGQTATSKLFKGFKVAVSDVFKKR